MYHFSPESDSDKERKVFNLFLKQPMFRIAQIIRERIPNGGRSLEEATKAYCFSSRSRDNDKTLLKPG